MAARVASLRTGTRVSPQRDSQTLQSAHATRRHWPSEAGLPVAAFCGLGAVCQTSGEEHHAEVVCGWRKYNLIRRIGKSSFPRKSGAARAMNDRRKHKGTARQVPFGEQVYELIYRSSTDRRAEDTSGRLPMAKDYPLKKCQGCGSFHT